MATTHSMKSEAVIYVRVSTKEQTDGYSLKTQEQACRRMALERGLAVLRVFGDPGVSARTTSRPGLEELLEYVVEHKRSVAVVVVHKVDRLSRRGRDYHRIQGMLETLDVAVITSDGSVCETDEGMLMGGISAAVAEYENRIRGRRAKEGMIACVRDGRWPWRAPLGYVNARDDAGKIALEHDPERARLIGRIFARFGDGTASYEALAKEAAAIGLTSRRGRRVPPSTIKKMLRNPIYYGEVLGFGIRKPGRHKAIAPAEVIHRVQHRLDGKRLGRRDYVRDNPDFPLRRFVRCGACAVGLTGSWSSGKSGTRYAYYRCRTSGCPTRSIARRRLEEDFVELLGGIAPSSETLGTFSTAIRKELTGMRRELRQETGRLRQRLEEIGTRKHELVAACLHKGILSEDNFQREMARLDEDERLVAEEMGDRECSMPDAEDVLRFVGECLADAERVWHTAPPDLKRRFQTLMFPEGLTFKDGKFGTPALSPIYELIGSYEASNGGLASLRVWSSNTSRSGC